jgi:hypothetical protein
MFIINVVGFNLVWFGLVYWGNIFVPIAIALLGAHIFYVSEKENQEVTLIFIVAIIGVVVDSTLQALGIFSFLGNAYLPVWLISLWFCFGATLNHSLGFLQNSKRLQVLVGAIIAPLSYLAGHQFKAVDFGLSVINTYLLLSVIWAVLMVSFFYIKSSLEKKEVSYG